MRWTQAISTMALCFATGSLAELWDRDIWAVGRRIGGDGGSEFQMVAEAGSVVKKIRVYKWPAGQKTSLKGIQLTFSDDTTQSAGALDGASQDYTFDDGELINTMTLWGNGVGKRTGRIHFTTSTGKTFDHGQNTDGQGDFPMEIGSGILIGFSGRAGKEIDSLAPVFIKKLTNRPVIDVLHLDDFDRNGGLKLETVSTKEGLWGGKPYTLTFAGTETATISKTVTKELSNSFAVGVTVTGSIPILGGPELSVSTQWTITKTQMESKTETRSKALTWSIDSVINGPEDEVSCTAEVWSGRIENLRWTGEVVLNTGDREYKLPTSGYLTVVDVSKVIATCARLNPGPVSTVQPPFSTIATSSGFTTVTRTSETIPGSSSTTLPSAQPGTHPDCAKFHKVIAGDTCHSIAQDAGITLEEFYTLNKKVTIEIECDNLYRGYDVCTGLRA